MVPAHGICLPARATRQDCRSQVVPASRPQDGEQPLLHVLLLSLEMLGGEFPYLPLLRAACLIPLPPGATSSQREEQLSCPVRPAPRYCCLPCDAERRGLPAVDTRLKMSVRAAYRSADHPPPARRQSLPLHREALRSPSCCSASGDRRQTPLFRALAPAQSLASVQPSRCQDDLATSSLRGVSLRYDEAHLRVVLPHSPRRRHQKAP